MKSSRQHAAVAQEAQQRVHRHVGRGALPVLAALDQHRATRVLRIGERAAFDHAQAGRVAGVDQQQLGHLQLSRQRRAFFATPSAAAADHQWRAGLAHRMDVEQQLGGIDERPQLAGAPQLDRIARAQQRLVAPDAVEVLVDIAAAVGRGRVPARIGRDVAEGQRQSAALRLPLCLLREQRIQRDGAADLVAVGQRLHHDLWPGAARIEAPHVGRAGVARRPARQVRRLQFDRAGCAHALILQQAPKDESPARAGLSASRDQLSGAAGCRRSTRQGCRRSGSGARSRRSLQPARRCPRGSDRGSAR